ncbi:hypothetical protein LX92_00521 [Maribacter polysiphoniae]|nr:hypothetical protein LX92_00521 [Maribacter polysiphoniae]
MNTHKEKEDKWHEAIFFGMIDIAIAITLLFNGFTAMAESFLGNDEIEGGPNKYKAIIAFVSKVEGGWWKYLIVIIILFIGFKSIRNGVLKYKKGRK